MKKRLCRFCLEVVRPGHKPHCRNCRGLIHRAIRDGDYALLEDLIAQGTDLEKIWQEQPPPLYHHDYFVRCCKGQIPYYAHLEQLVLPYLAWDVTKLVSGYCREICPYLGPSLQLEQLAFQVLDASRQVRHARQLLRRANYRHVRDRDLDDEKHFYHWCASSDTLVQQELAAWNQRRDGCDSDYDD